MSSTASYSDSFAFAFQIRNLISRILKRPVAKPLNKFPIFYGTRKRSFIIIIGSSNRCSEADKSTVHHSMISI
jgi:hypothetical protein